MIDHLCVRSSVFFKVSKKVPKKNSALRAEKNAKKELQKCQKKTKIYSKNAKKELFRQKSGKKCQKKIPAAFGGQKCQKRTKNAKKNRRFAPKKRQKRTRFSSFLAFLCQKKTLIHNPTRLYIFETYSSRSLHFWGRRLVMSELTTEFTCKFILQHLIW